MYDFAPAPEVVGRTEPARQPRHDGLEGPARVCRQDGRAGEHGLEGHNPKVLVRGRVEDQAGGPQEAFFELVGDGKEEEDIYVVGNAEGCHDVFGGCGLEAE